MWLDVVIVALFVVGIYCFAVLTGWQTRLISRRTNRRAEDMYGQYAGSPHKQRRFAKEHGGTWQDDEHGGTWQDDPARPGSPR
jgi:HAMP domain-containing protein